MAKLIEQPPGSSVCSQCVVAMLTESTLAAVCEIMGIGRNYPADVNKALKQLGFAFTNKHSEPIINGMADPDRPGAVFAYIPIEGRDAAHWLAWDGTQFLDPRNGLMERIPDDWKCRIYYVGPLTEPY